MLARCLLIVCFVSGTSSAQVVPVQRTVVVKSDVSVHGREAVVMKVDIAPNGSIGRHTHHGEEMGYVQDGDIEMLIEGEAPRSLKAGDGFIIPSGKIHEARNIGSGTARVIVTYVVEKDKPLTVPAK